MKSIIFSVFLLSLFLLPLILAEKTKCYVCHGVDSKTCEEKEKECEEGSDCITISEEFGSLGKKSASIYKRCALNFPCNTTFHVQSGNDVYLRLNTDCCSGPLCNSGNYNMPTENQTEPKGRLCPTCYAFNTMQGCNATKSSVCPGEDDECVRFRGTLKPPGGKDVDFSGKGCSSKEACKLDYSALIGMKITKQLEHTCYKPETTKPSN
ncbi:phospholipase A2 inhibitor and Ly6/PLAUR domain-containing protein-like [Rana temporaria]|uniref:phospholipase A2 inhibitor and Ly6/PLAUR domain-containing protein-like n=1 Tax=Rana temporaria TaxID=8407 RepID=UPI001AAD0F13|nr:phospholipase A2 inhibitor and Ly6/PLAUR domain-containing protein-like [Rana temporaria]